MTSARRVQYEGRVQGVGFRFTTRQVASGYEVTGWVRNLPDGRVEMEACGEREEVDAFLKAIAQGPLGSNIRKTSVEELEPPPAYKGFSIR